MDIEWETVIMSKFLIAALALILLGLAIYSPNIVRLYKLANLYNEKSIAKNCLLYTSDAADE